MTRIFDFKFRTQANVWWSTLILACCSTVLAAIWAVGSARAARHTSLQTARNWLVIAEAAVVVMIFSDPVLRLWPGQTSDYGWCLAAIFLLCPPVAVLGARRPGVQIWTCFILLPMVLVLSWPVWTVLVQGTEARGLALELPTVLAFEFVLLMGVGNFFGTRSTWSAIAYFAGTSAIFLTCAGWSFTRDHEPFWREVGVLLLILAGLFRRRQMPTPRHPVNRLWDDFRNLYGIVWALRMVERINALAVQEKWTIRLSYDGFPEAESGRVEANEPEVAAACCWLFRRFVDDEWVNERLGNS